jgi:DNA-binding SARP family transcriptional activator
VEFRVLGPLEVEDDGGKIEIGPAKERALLALLVLARGRPVSTESLIDAMWTDPPVSAAKSIQVYVAHLRRALGSERIVTRERGYELLLEDGELDLDRFERLTREASNADPVRAAELLADALGLVRGPPLADLALEPWAAPEAARLRDRVLDVTEARIDADLALGRHRQLVPEIEALTTEHPFREHLLTQLMVALYRSGRQADALAAYRRGAARLRDEVGLEPGSALRELEGRLLRQDESLEVAAANGAEGTKRRSWRVIAVGAVALLGAAIATVAIILTSHGTTALASLPPGVAVIDTRTGQLVSHISKGEIAVPAEAVKGDGVFWVWNLSPLSLVGVRAATGRVIERIASPTGGDTSGWLQEGNDVWFTTMDGLVRVDAGQGRVVDRSPISRRHEGRFGLTWMTRCAGSMWVVDADNNSVLRLDGTPPRVRARIAVPNPWAIACMTGQVWVTSNGSGLSRIDPATDRIVTTAPIETHLDQIAVAGGYAWTTDEQRGTLYKVDRTGKIQASYETGDGARQLSYAGGRIWVANQDVGTVSGVDVVTGDVRTFQFGHPVQTVAALGNRLLVALNDGLTYEDRIDQLRGKVARLIVPVYVFDPSDPAVASTPWSFLVERATCSTLLAVDRSRPSALRPDLAAAMPRVSNGGRTYTFTVRTDRRFAPPSGARVTPESIRMTIERALSPKLAVESPAAGLVDDLVGAVDYHSGVAPHISGIRVRGRTISFTLEAASRTLPTRLSQPFFCTVPPGTPALEGGFPDVAPPSAGPYYMSDRLNGEYTILKHNPNYDGPSPAKLDAIAFREGLAPETAVARVRSGAWDGALLADTLVAPDSAVAVQARHSPRLRYQALSDLGTTDSPAPPVYALLSTRLGCLGSSGTVDLAALCLR